jgi:hypothetical protein
MVRSMASAPATLTPAPSGSDYDIVKFRPEHKALVAELQKELWSSDAALNERYLDWKYPSRPGAPQPLVYLALHRGRAVGMRGFHEARLEAGAPSQIFRVLIAGDAVVAPAHRNRGLVARILDLAWADMAAGDHPYAVSVGGANRVNTLGLLTLGWKSAGALEPVGRTSAQARRREDLSRALRRLPIVWRLSESRCLYSADQRRPFRHLDAARTGRGAVAGLPVSVESEPRTDDMAALVSRLGHDGRIRYLRDREYLGWRFRNPMSEYRFLYWTEQRLEGYLVLSRRASDLGGWERVYIADLEAGDPRIRRELLAAAIAWGRFPELVTWNAGLSKRDADLLADQGLVPVDPEDRSRGCPGILVRPLADARPAAEWQLGNRDLLDIRDWDVRVLYSMRG